VAEKLKLAEKFQPCLAERAGGGGKLPVTNSF